VGTGLKKLLKLKDWLTVPDAARHLSVLFDEDVTEADVLRFALDGRLVLSIDFVDFAAAQLGKIIPLADAKTKTVQTTDGKSCGLINGIRQVDGNVVSFDGNFRFIKGVWDLAMCGAERIEIERKYRLLTDGPTVSLGEGNGILINRPDGTWGQLLEAISDSDEFGLWRFLSDNTYGGPDKLYPAQTFPSGAILVVRTSAVLDLVALSEPETPMERPLRQRERDSLLVIIAALAEVHGIDIKRTSKAAMEIESATIQKGARVSARSIEDHLRRIPDALERKAAEDEPKGAAD